MNRDRWTREQDPVRLMMKAQEEIGEVQHAFNRGQRLECLEEIEHARFILGLLDDAIMLHGIPDTRGAVYHGVTAEGR